MGGGATVELRHGDTTTAVAIKCYGGLDGQATWTAASRPLMRSERLRQCWKAVADPPGARIAVPCRGFAEWSHNFYVPPVPGVVFYLAALRHQGGFAFLTRDSSGFAPLEFHHRTLIALDEAGAVAWASSSGDDLSALDATINGALVEGSRHQPPIDEVLGRCLAVALDEDSEGSESDRRRWRRWRRRGRRASLWPPPGSYRARER